MSDRIVDNSKKVTGLNSPLVAEAYKMSGAKPEFASKVSSLTDETELAIDVLAGCIKSSIADEGAQGIDVSGKMKGKSGLSLERSKKDFNIAGTYDLSKEDVLAEANARNSQFGERMETLLKHFQTVKVVADKNQNITKVELITNRGVVKNGDGLEFVAKDRSVPVIEGSLTVVPKGVQLENKLVLKPELLNGHMYFSVLGGGKVVNHVSGDVSFLGIAKHIDRDVELKVSRLSMMTDGFGRCIPLIGVDKPALSGGGIKYKFIPVDKTGKRLNNEVIAKL